MSCGRYVLYREPVPNVATANGAEPKPAEPTSAKGAAQYRGLALRCTGSGGQESAACALACRVQHTNEHEAAGHVAGLARGSAATADEVARQLALDIGEWRAMGNAERRGAWMGMSRHERLELWRGLGR